MKVTEHIAQAKKTLFSFEILPPLKGAGIQTIYHTLDPLMEFKPPFINVTYHRSEFIFRKTADGNFEKKIVRKRPGTAGLSTAIMTKYGVDAVPHLICGGFTIDETEDLLIELDFLGINNVLLLRGDKMKSEEIFTPQTDGHKNAIELVQQTVRMNKGIYLEEELNNAMPTDFCIGVAGYPEKHYEATDMNADIQNLKAKVDAGAHYIVTQMFFNNKKYFEFVNACRAAGITVPIIPGLKPITNKKQITNLPKIFFVDFPTELLQQFDLCKTDDDYKKAGIEWSIQQCKELIQAKVPVLHFYTMSNSSSVVQVVSQLG
ncbi:MAG: methylenetetrahydrofolate reductase [NAD(P)H] [Bacteroidota bacterium]